MTENELAELDALLVTHEHHWWDAFYEDRAKPCGFFGTSPDESLAEWVREGTIRTGRALELGCGNGRNAIYLARQGFAVEGVDYSQRAVDWAKERSNEAGLKIALTCDSVFGLDAPVGAYELAYDSGCFHHIPPHRRNQYVDLVVSALKPGGWFGLACFTPEGGSGYSDDEVYQRRSMGGGLGYAEARLRQVWSRGLQIRVIRPMRKQSPDSQFFGETFLWALLAQKP